MGQHVGVREAQAALMPFWMKNGKGSLLSLAVCAGDRGHVTRLQRSAPLALILQEIRDRIDGGWWLVDRKPDPRWTCSWCHGTGELQLSVASMERAVSA